MKLKEETQIGVWLVTTLTAKAVSFSANACVNYRYVSCRRLRPSLEYLESVEAVNLSVLNSTAGLRDSVVSNLGLLYREKVCSPEPAEYPVVKGTEAPADDTPIIQRSGGVRAFPRLLKRSVPCP